MIDVLIEFLIVLLFFSIIWVIVSRIPMPEPFRQIAQIVMLIVFLLVVLVMLTPLIHGGRLGLGYR